MLLNKLMSAYLCVLFITTEHDSMLGCKLQSVCRAGFTGTVPPGNEKLWIATMWVSALMKNNPFILLCQTQPISTLSGLISGFSVLLDVNVYKQYFITVEPWLFLGFECCLCTCSSPAFCLQCIAKGRHDLNFGSYVGFLHSLNAFAK